MILYTQQKEKELITMKSIIKNWIKNEATDDEVIQIVSEVNSWDGSLEEYAFYDMDSLDDFFCDVKPTEFLSKLADDFDVNDEGYKDTMYGLESCSKDDIVEEIKNNNKIFLLQPRYFISIFPHAPKEERNRHCRNTPHHIAKQTCSNRMPL